MPVTASPTPSPVSDAPRKAWCCMLSKESYLAGLVVFWRSLRINGQTKYPLLVYVPPTLPERCIRVMEAADMQVRVVDLLQPEMTKKSFDAFDSRFEDNWTKLIAYGFTEYDQIVNIDCDMIVTQPIDDLLDMDLADGEIAAVHACTCNPRKHAHYPIDWVPATCPHTAAKASGPVVPTKASPPTHHLLNGGLIVIRPSLEIFNAMLFILNTNPIVREMGFADQDFQTMFFKDRWRPLPYTYNALKTLRWCHADLWKDEDVKIVHYIMEKPWSAAPGSVKERKEDAVVSKWWWREFKATKAEWIKAGKDADLWNVVEATVSAE